VEYEIFMRNKSVYIHGTHTEEQSRLSLLNELTNASFLTFLNIPDNGTVLELGSGLGILTYRVALNEPGSTVIGIEISPDQILKAAADFHRTPNLQFIEGDASVLPFKDSSFDVVFCRYLLEHVHDPEIVIREAFRVLKHNSRIFIQENNILINVMDPECPVYSFVLHKFIALQAQMGGDGEIGKKLFRLLKQRGFSSIDISIEPEVHHFDMPTFNGWISNSVKILAGAKNRLLQLDGMSEQVYRKAIQELEDLRINHFGSAYFYWNRASALKP
jgi:ubiquinone/menaquinone biosynthesis C-methylase UbiE